jgi:hypothetical protein
MRRFLPWVVAALGPALVVTGVVVFVRADRPGGFGDFGWTAHAPQEPGAPAPHRGDVLPSFDHSVLWTTAHLAAAGPVVLGLLVLTGPAGRLLGRRSGARSATVR